MRVKAILVGATLAILVVAGSARADSIFQELRWCGEDDSDRSLVACTAVIQWSHGRPPAKVLAEAYTDRANIYGDRGDTDKAIADFTNAIHHDPTRDDAFVGRGMQYYDHGDYKHAVADFDAAVRLNPNEATNWAWRGRAKAHLGDMGGADADIEHAHHIDPQVEDSMPNEEE